MGRRRWTGRHPDPADFFFGKHRYDADLLDLYGKSPFNCLMPYGSPDRQQMDLAQQHGLKVIYSVKDWYAGLDSCPKSIQLEADEEPQVRARVREFRDHPALLAWYLNDELPQQYLPRLEAHYRWVAEEDVDHPTTSPWSGGRIARW